MRIVRDNNGVMFATRKGKRWHVHGFDMKISKVYAREFAFLMGKLFTLKNLIKLRTGAISDSAAIPVS